MKRLLTVVALLASLALQAQNEDVITYINTWKELAMAEMQRTGVPASITLAQGIHESMAGKSPLSLRSNNHFGIKCKAEWQGEKVYHDDDARQECFRSYPSPEQSYTDHSDFLRNGARYGFLFQLDPADYKEWALGLKKAGYATNVRYPQILIKLIEDYNLQQYSLIAMGTMPREQEEILVSNRTTPVIREIETTITPKEKVEEVVVNDEELIKKYPSGEFTINNTKVILAKAGSSLLVLANQYNISLGRLLDFNDMKQEDVLVRTQLLFLQRKRKSGASDIHRVMANESLYDIAQAEGIRMESLLEYNFLQEYMQPAPGENLYLKATGPGRPKLAGEPGGGSSSDMADNANASTHVVQDKESLFSIARKYNTTVAKLREWNKLAAGDVRVGQELVVYKN